MGYYSCNLIFFYKRKIKFRFPRNKTTIVALNKEEVLFFYKRYINPHLVGYETEIYYIIVF